MYFARSTASIDGVSSMKCEGASARAPMWTVVRIVETLHEAPPSIRMTHSRENRVSPGHTAGRLLKPDGEMSQIRSAPEIPRIRDLQDGVDGAVALFFRRVEVRSDADTRLRPVVHDDVASDEFVAHALAFGDVDRDRRPAAFGSSGTSP
jgi:hypothetical protein